MSLSVLQVVEEAIKKTPGNADLEEELAKAREELRSAMQEKEEAEAEQKLAEAQQHHAFFVKVSPQTPLRNGMILDGKAIVDNITRAHVVNALVYVTVFV